MVRNAIRSIISANSSYENWHLAAIDDSSHTPLRPIVEESMGDYLSQISFYNTSMTPEEKKSKGSYVSDCLNKAIRDSDAEVAIFLCDDDELVPNYLAGLAKLMTNNRNIIYCYSHIHLYNPAFERAECVDNLNVSYNRFNSPIRPMNRIDASQIAWRTSIHRKKNIWFKSPCNRDHDKDIMSKIYAFYGKAPFSGLVSQYKGMHALRLFNHSEKSIWSGDVKIDLPDVKPLTSADALSEIIARYKTQEKIEEATRICKEALLLHPDENSIRELAKELDVKTDDAIAVHQKQDIIDTNSHLMAPIYFVIKMIRAVFGLFKRRKQ